MFLLSSVYQTFNEVSINVSSGDVTNNAEGL